MSAFVVGTFAVLDGAAVPKVLCTCQGKSEGVEDGVIVKVNLWMCVPDHCNRHMVSSRRRSWMPMPFRISIQQSFLVIANATCISLERLVSPNVVAVVVNGRSESPNVAFRPFSLLHHAATLSKSHVLIDINTPSI